jgi:hypothetical protein
MEMAVRLDELLDNVRRTLERRGLSSVKEAGNGLKVIQGSLQTFLRTHPPTPDETFDLTTLLDYLHFCSELGRETWARVGADLRGVGKVVEYIGTYVRLRLTMAGLKPTTTFLPSSSNNPHPHKRAKRAPTSRLPQQQIQRKYAAKMEEVQGHLDSLIKVPLSLTLNLTHLSHSRPNP